MNTCITNIVTYHGFVGNENYQKTIKYYSLIAII